MIHQSHSRGLQDIPWTIQWALSDKFRCTCPCSRWVHFHRLIETQVSELQIICTLCTAINHLCIANARQCKVFQTSEKSHIENWYKLRASPWAVTMADMQGINKFLHVVWMQDVQGHPVLELHRAIVIFMPHQGGGTRRDHISPESASTLDSLHLHGVFLRELEQKQILEVSECLTFNRFWCTLTLVWSAAKGNKGPKNWLEIGLRAFTTLLYADDHLLKVKE